MMGKTMNFIELCKEVSENGFLCFRPTKDDPAKYETTSYDERSKTKGWVLLDAVTANVCLQVYNAVSDEGRAKIDQWTAEKLIDLAYQAISVK